MSSRFKVKWIHVRRSLFITLYLAISIVMNLKRITTRTFFDAMMVGISPFSSISQLTFSYCPFLEPFLSSCSWSFMQSPSPNIPSLPGFGIVT
jgi:hypothetical protein